MKTNIILTTTLTCLLICNVIYPQTGESKFKMVVVNANERKVSPLLPSFSINNLSFTDSNMNRQLDAKEDGSIRFYIKNTGTVLLKGLSVNLNIPNSTIGINFNSKYSVDQIAPGDSAIVNIPLQADEKIKDGIVPFDILITDSYSDSTKTAKLDIMTKEISMAPVFAWINPAAVYDSTDFAIFNVNGVVKTNLNITGLKVYVNGQVPNDNRGFDVLPSENPNEYKITRSIMLSEGINEIKIEAKTSQGMTMSDPRIINYFVQKINHSYVERRLALVIGNADYVNSNALQNPLNDAKAIAAALKDVGFTVLLFLDSDLKTMKKAMDEFGEKLREYTIGLFYYAGHGIQVKGNNYLIPVDALLKVEQDVDYDCVDAGRLLGKMESAGSSTNIVILDACRDNPFARSWSGRSAGQGETGLAFMNAPSGSIVAYATSPGKTASDGKGKNGLYTEAFLKYVKIPNLSIEDFFKNVRIEVERSSNRTQTPWESTSLKGNFYFTIK